MSDPRAALRGLSSGSMYGLSTEEILRVRQACDRVLAERWGNETSLEAFIDTLPARLRPILREFYSIPLEDDARTVYAILVTQPVDLIAVKQIGPTSVNQIQARLRRLKIPVEQTNWGPKGLRRAFIEAVRGRHGG